MQRQYTRIEIYSRIDTGVQADNRWIETAHFYGIRSITGCWRTRIFFVLGDLSQEQIDHLSRELLVDPVLESYSTEQISTDNVNHYIETALHPGVTDPVAENLLRACEHIGLNHITQVATGERYLLQGDISQEELETLATRVFSNPVIQHFAIDTPIAPPFIETSPKDNRVDLIAIRAADDAALEAISKDRRLALDLAEMQAIKAYYQSEDRDPSDVELETIAQTWSEHCSHKSFKAQIRYEGPDGQIEEIDGLLKTFIRAATEKINKPWVHSAFVDNAGIIAFNDDWDLAFKVETHNHPSALEPFGGANTGVGGVVRDVIGVSARPIANTDVLCFGPEDIPQEDLLSGVLHPRRIAEGVIHGIEDYGNKMGIPTLNGAIFYGPGYTANPLVFCGCLGILPRGSHRTQVNPGDLIIVLGGRTGRDGLRGATFSSMEMDTTTGEIAGSSVQIGHPVHEKQVQDVVLRARSEGLYSAITDCGAGGLSSAIGEMGRDTGARVYLERVPLKYPGLRPWEIWLSEAQERMVLAVPIDKWERLQQIAEEHDIDIVAVGAFNDTGRLHLEYEGQVVGQMTMDFLHDGIPQRLLQAVWKRPQSRTHDTLPHHVNISETLLKLLSHPNIRSKEDVIRRYDHEVQGSTALKPLVGVNAHGPGDATILVPQDTQPTIGETAVRAVALSNGICPQYGEIDPYAMAWAAVDEAFRNAVATGADPGQIAILDNFCWGNPKLADRLGTLVEAARGCHDAAIAYQTPFISGKDSLNNEYADETGQRHAIPGTLLISAVGIVPDVTKTVSMDLKSAGEQLYLIGTTRAELGASHFNMVHGLTGGQVPQPQPTALDLMRKLHQAIQAGLVSACHDLSEGGLAVAIAEMCIAGQLGAIVEYSQPEDVNLKDIDWLFSESTTRFIVAIPPEKVSTFTAVFADQMCTRIGSVTTEPTLEIRTAGGIERIELSDLEMAWRGSVSGPAEQYPASTLFETANSFGTYISNRPRVMILHAPGTNRDHDAALACELAGGQPEIVHIHRLTEDPALLHDYQMLVIPGGFSYGDDLGAGQLWGVDLRYRLQDSLQTFVERARPVLGICNGFQVLIKSGLLPDGELKTATQRRVTLTNNVHQRFECRWVYLKAHNQSDSIFTHGIDTLIHCPVAHGEGRFIATDNKTLSLLEDNGQIALTYVNADGSESTYPGNPNGSDRAIAGISNSAGNVLGLMPHPENHVFGWQHPRWRNGLMGGTGLVLFQNGIRNA